MKKNKFVEKIEENINLMDKIYDNLTKHVNVTDLVVDKVVELSKKHLNINYTRNAIKLWFAQESIIVMYETLLRYDEHQRIEEYFKKLKKEKK